MSNEEPEGIERLVGRLEDFQVTLPENAPKASLDAKPKKQ